MKNIKNIIITSILLLGLLSACGDNGYEITEPQLKVLKSDGVFEPKASQGSIELSIKEGVTVKSDKDWCTVSVNNGIVAVSLTKNTSIETRYANILISAAGETITALVSQQGSRFIEDGKDLYRLTLDGGTVQIQIKTDVDFDIETTADWLKYTLDENGILTLTADENDIARFAELVLTAKFAEGNKVVRIKVDQDLYTYKHFLGAWTFSFTDGSNNKIDANITLGVHKDKVSYSFPMTELGLPLGGSLVLTYSTDDAGYHFTIANNQYLGPYGANHIFSHMWDPEEGYFTWDTGVAYTALYNGQGIPTLKFQDNGVWGDYVVNALLLYARQGNTPESTGVGTLYRIKYLTMTKK